MQVKFTYKDGRERLMSRRDADILQKLRRGTYLTRDMRAQEPAVVVETEKPAKKQARKKKEADE